VTVELVDRCISKLKGGKAAAHDGLTTEHLWYAHPIIATLITYICLNLTSVLEQSLPTDFGCGVAIPLVKNTDGDGDIPSSESYRGITLLSLANCSSWF